MLVSAHVWALLIIIIIMLCYGNTALTLKLEPWSSLLMK